MRSTIRLLILPALTGAALTLSAAGFLAPASAADFPRDVAASSWHRGGHSWHGGGQRSWRPREWRTWQHSTGEWSGHHRHDADWRHRPDGRRPGRRHHHRHFGDGLVHLPALPILIEQAPRENFRYEHPAYRAPGVPDAVPYVHAGPRFAGRGGTYVSSFYNGYGSPEWLPGSGTYAGDIEAVRDPGNGTYFVVYGNGGGISERKTVPPSPKIIHVTPETSRAACQMEAGVCVIRP